MSARPAPPLPPPLIGPDPAAPGLTRTLAALDETGAVCRIRVVEERPLTLYLNGREIVTVLTIGDHPDFLAVGYLVNQGMLPRTGPRPEIAHDAELGAVAVRSPAAPGLEAMLARRTRTTGCAVGTVFGDIMAGLDGVRLPEARLGVSALLALARGINALPSLYRAAGAIHGTVLCSADRPIVYMEDVGRHNAVDKIAGWMTLGGVAGADKLLYTTGRLTSEMVIKCALMGIPILASRSGFTASGVAIARRVGLTLVGRLRGDRYLCLAGARRLVRDGTPPAAAASARGRA